MCKAWPGPRCTNHAQKRLLAAQARLKELHAEAPHSEACIEARREHAQALEEWDSTPGGQKRLKEELSTTESKFLTLKDSPDADQRELAKLREKVWTLKGRIEGGKELRRKRNNLYKFHQRHAAGERFPLNERWDLDHKLDNSWQTADGDEIRVYNLHPSYRKADYSKCAWRIRDGEPVAMVRFFDSTYQGHDNIAVLCDIEVSPFYRGDGLGVQTIKELDSKYGRLHTSGSYSTSGHRSLSKHVPLYEGAVESVSPTTTHYEFVDWEQGDLIRY